MKLMFGAIYPVLRTIRLHVLVYAEKLMDMIAREPLTIPPVQSRVLRKLRASLPVAGAASVPPPFRGGES
jgi:hypothetical protein